ncbi:hypothetical protein AJ79_01439 [Helicocarpus griseus UAMH5409]|uniref:AAA+ ATPase domain-containing protein n=1 Tax=Helicocarpus griseus UAMH5409 TaxID=1447875 RepID=A0A2B7Y755_9EURO|nr:hypothetical protein AJ79_01439 [Helicocarpus griseus UAMH5409]
MSKPTKSNNAKAPSPSSSSSPPPPRTLPGSPNNEDPPQHVTMEQLQQIFMAALRQVKQPSESSEPIADVKSEIRKNKGGNEVKTQASELKYKEVHEVWDKDNSKYKIVESVGEDKALDDLDQMTKETKTFVDIKSEALLGVLREIVRDVRAINLREDKPSIECNFLYNFLPDLEKYTIKKGRNHRDPCSKHVDLLIKYIKETYASTTQSLLPLLKRGEITYDLLWTIFKPGIFVYSTFLGTGKPRCVIFDAGEEKTKMNGIKYFSLDCRYLDFDGEVFGEAGTQLEVVRFHGPRPIHNLEAFPLDHHPNKSDAMKSLINCGRNFCDLKGQHIRHCRGRAFVQVRGEIVQISINSRIMVDPAFFRQMNPNYTRPRINQRSESYSGSSINIDAILDNQDQRKREQVKSNGVNPSEMKDVDFLICCPTVLGYCFSENLWMEFAVADLDQVQWSSVPFENLRIPSQQRDTLLALAKTRLGLVPSVPFDDFVTGKGRGLNVLLYGGPGLGKTFTAEAMAEHLQRPLYRVAAGELIHDKCLEERVSDIFKIANHFNAILLVDEADVFLHGRSIGGAHDHSVTVFLRKLEYFWGILFLTTNRVDEFDDAILSRMHYKLKYEDLSRESRREIWRNFLSKAHTHKGSAQVSDDELYKLEGLDLSARDIKNLVMIAHALATVHGDHVSYAHLEQAVDSNDEFAGAFNSNKRLDTMYN